MSDKLDMKTHPRIKEAEHWAPGCKGSAVLPSWKNRPNTNLQIMSEEITPETLDRNHLLPTGHLSLGESTNTNVEKKNNLCQFCALRCRIPTLMGEHVFIKLSFSSFASKQLVFTGRVRKFYSPKGQLPQGKKKTKISCLASCWPLQK